MSAKRKYTAKRPQASKRARELKQKRTANAQKKQLGMFISLMKSEEEEE